MADGNTEIRRGRKFDQVLNGARDVFMASGYDGASVDEIARVAGVSKATLYSYFPDKRLLFAEVARVECERQAEESMAEIDGTAAPDLVLYEAGKRLVGFMTSEFGRQVVSLCAAESGRFPELGAMFYASGPGLMRNHMCEYLAACEAEGTLRVDDPLLAADQFSELCKARIFPRIICSVQTRFPPEEIELVVKGAVEMFMARYGP